jgi:VWFA-related protein
MVKNLLICTILAGTGLVAFLAAQDPPKTDPSKPDQSKESVFKETFKFVVAPVTVIDRDGNFVSGLTPYDFRLFDNGKPQRITEDVADHPISLVVVIQANAATENVIKQVQKIGSVIDGTILGESGEAAVIAFDHRVQKLLPFTSEPGKVAEALKKLKPGSYSSNLNDATMEAINMLRVRPTSRRRAILLIAESRDKGSEMSVREVLTNAEFNDVVIYPVNISHLLTSLTTAPPPPRPDNRPPGAVHLPAGNVSTPTVESQHEMGNYIPVFEEIFKGAKAIFVPNPLEVYSKYTGGREYSFKSQGALERAVSEIGAELHSQYLLLYRPNNESEGGFHEITVQILKPELKVRTRTGYWVAAKPN